MEKKIKIKRLWEKSAEDSLWYCKDSLMEEGARIVTTKSLK